MQVFVSQPLDFAEKRPKTSNLQISAVPAVRCCRKAAFDFSGFKLVSLPCFCFSATGLDLHGTMLMAKDCSSSFKSIRQAS